MLDSSLMGLKMTTPSPPESSTVSLLSLKPTLCGRPPPTPLATLAISSTASLVAVSPVSSLRQPRVRAAPSSTPRRSCSSSSCRPLRSLTRPNVAARESAAAPL